MLSLSILKLIYRLLFPYRSNELIFIILWIIKITANNKKNVTFFLPKNKKGRNSIKMLKLEQMNIPKYPKTLPIIGLYIVRMN